MAPAKGWPNPHSRFWIASASAKTSRPQPLAFDRGVRKKPSDERGPKVSTEIEQPHRISTAGTRHETERAREGTEDDVMRKNLPGGSRRYRAPPAAAMNAAAGPASRWRIAV